MKPTLLVLAAGMGSRFGGLKQMEPIGPSGEWLLDYSVHDARRAGFGKVLFVIRKEMEDEFVALTRPKYENQIEVGYVFQEMSDLPMRISGSAERAKPWGTGHAVYAAREQIQTAFAVINADDFYGREAFSALARFLTEPSHQRVTETYALVGYELANTLSEHGTVSRGVCSSNSEGDLLSIEEHTEIGFDAEGTIRGKNGVGEPTVLSEETAVSLNCWGFPAAFMTRLESLFIEFLKERGEEPKAEFYLPAAVDRLVERGAARAVVLPCSASWLGVTHREDLPQVRTALARLTEEGVYQSPLNAENG